MAKRPDGVCLQLKRMHQIRWVIDKSHPLFSIYILACFGENKRQKQVTLHLSFMLILMLFDRSPFRSGLEEGPCGFLIETIETKMNFLLSGRRIQKRTRGL